MNIHTSSQTSTTMPILLYVYNINYFVYRLFSLLGSAAIYPNRLGRFLSLNTLTGLYFALVPIY